MFKKALLSLLFCGLCFGVVSTTTSRISYSTGSSVVAFTFPFPIINTSDLVVILRTDATGAETVLTETTHYAVSAVNNDYTAGGTVTTVSTYAAGYTLLIMRNTPQTQGTDLTDSGTRRFEAIEQALDKLSYINIQQQTELNRCLKIPRSDATSLTTELDDSVNRASKNLTFDASGNATVTASLNTGSASISAFGASIIDDANAAAAMTTLDLTGKAIGLLSTTTVSFAGNAHTTLYTVPAGKRCILSEAYVVANADAGATTAVTIGQNGAETDFIPSTVLSNLDAQYDVVKLQPIMATPAAKNKSYATGTVIEMAVATQSGAAGNTVYLFGFLY